MSKLAKALTAAAGNAGGDNLYVEDVFSTYLYTGTGASLPIVNGIDLADAGGLVWTKRRTSANSNWFLDSERGGNQIIRSNTTEAQFTSAGLEITSFNSDGYTLGTAVDINSATQDDVSWTFRKAEKFFDVVTYSSDTTSGARTISHNLGSTPAFIIVKGLNFSDSWYVYHISTGVNKYLELNLTGAGHASTNFWGVTDSTFTVDSFLNNNGLTGKDYVAYLFASDAGGFGDDDESIIKCGSYTGTGSIGLQVDLGFEPQWVLLKAASRSSPWALVDNMRGFLGQNTQVLQANSTSDEFTTGLYNTGSIQCNATGFSVETNDNSSNGSGDTYIYIAIRRPMKTPESGTEVFAIDTPDSTSPPKYRSSFPVDMAWFRSNINSTGGTEIANRLTGTKYLNTTSTAAEGNQNSYTWDFQNGWYNDQGTETNNRSWMFKRATGFMDVVAYTGDGSGAKSFNHNLGVIPELMIVKGRNYIDSWYVYVGSLGSSNRVKLNTDAASGSTGTLWNNTSPTATQFTVGSGLNVSAETNITYLFATLAGVSKVGSYTGTGSNVDVDCGFSAGARFILIKRTDSTGDWFYWDYERGITAGNDPYLLLNSTAAQVTNTDYIDPLSSGFTVTSGASFDGLNNSGGNYIFLAIA